MDSVSAIDQDGPSIGRKPRQLDRDQEGDNLIETNSLALEDLVMEKESHTDSNVIVLSESEDDDIVCVSQSLIVDSEDDVIVLGVSPPKARVVPPSPILPLDLSQRCPLGKTLLDDLLADAMVSTCPVLCATTTPNVCDHNSSLASSPLPEFGALSSSHHVSMCASPSLSMSCSSSCSPHHTSSSSSPSSPGKNLSDSEATGFSSDDSEEESDTSWNVHIKSETVSAKAASSTPSCISVPSFDDMFSQDNVVTSNNNWMSSSGTSVSMAMQQSSSASAPILSSSTSSLISSSLSLQLSPNGSIPNNYLGFDLPSPKLPSPDSSKPPIKLTFTKQKAAPKSSTPSSSSSSTTTNDRLVFRRTISAPQKSLLEIGGCSVPLKKRRRFGMSFTSTSDSSPVAASVPVAASAPVVAASAAASSTQKLTAPAVLPTPVTSYSDMELDEAGDDSESRRLATVQYICHQCQESVSEWKVAFCGARHACCGACIEKEVAKFLASARKGFLGCVVPNCKKCYTTHALQGLLPPLVIEIIEQKEAKETIENLTAWLQKDDMFKGMFDSVDGDADDRQSREKELVDKVFSVPSHWEHMDDKLEYKLVDMGESSQEYKAITDIFYRSMQHPRAQVHRIRRVQNRNLWRFYCMKKFQMEKAYQSTEGLEKQLFHGTTRNLLEAICSNNFDWRLCGAHGTLFGQGSYFASNACYSHNYTDRNPEAASQAAKIQMLRSMPYYNGSLPPLPPLPGVQLSQGQLLKLQMSAYIRGGGGVGGPIAINAPFSTTAINTVDGFSQQGGSLSPKPHLHMMFVARVLHGHYVFGKPHYRKPPPRDEQDKYGKCWDSCVNRQSDPDIFVIFDHSQCYPEYVIEYTNKLHGEF